MNPPVRQQQIIDMLRVMPISAEVSAEDAAAFLGGPVDNVRHTLTSMAKAGLLTIRREHVPRKNGKVRLVGFYRLAPGMACAPAQEQEFFDGDPDPIVRTIVPAGQWKAEFQKRAVSIFAMADAA